MKITFMILLITQLTLSIRQISEKIITREHLPKNNDGIRYCFAPCSDEYDPVCAKSGKTYNNSCQLLCGTNEEFAYKGVCKNDGKKDSSSCSEEESSHKHHHG